MLTPSPTTEDDVSARWLGLMLTAVAVAGGLFATRDHVRRGQLLAELDTRELSAQRDEAQATQVAARLEPAGYFRSATTR